MIQTATLKITCKDRPGLIAGITNFIYHNLGNIIALDQHVDNQTGTFFMRLEWDLSKFLIAKEALPAALTELAEKKNFSNQWELFFSGHLPKAAVFVSKYDHCLYDLLLRQKSGELQCQIPLIISNHQDLKYIAETFNIPFYYLPATASNKPETEKKALKLLAEHQVDFIILARYMQILSNNFIKKYPHKIINIHHSFLPAFKGAKPYHQAYAKGVKIIGATSHFVTAELDQGPIIQQDVVSISHKDSIDDLITKGRDLERKVLAQAVRLFIEQRLFVCNNRTIVL